MSARRIAPDRCAARRARVRNVRPRVGNASNELHKSFDVLLAFKDVLGKTISELPANYEQGELLIDSTMELETNATKGLSAKNSLSLAHGSVSETGVVKIAQTFRSGTNDIDAEK